VLYISMSSHIPNCSKLYIDHGRGNREAFPATQTCELWVTMHQLEETYPNQEHDIASMDCLIIDMKGHDQSLIDIQYERYTRKGRGQKKRERRKKKGAQSISN